jgi:predicted kinase
MTALILPAGAPGSGKTSWTAAAGLSHYSIGLDPIRRIICGDESDMTMDSIAVAFLHIAVCTRIMHSGVLTVVDNTNYLPAYRKPMIDMARASGWPVIAVVFDVPAQECLRRIATRERDVPAPVVHRISQYVRESMLTLPQEADTVVTISETGQYTITGAPVPADPPQLREVAFAPLYQ